MTITESPAFSMNGGSSLAKLTIAAGGAITATLNSTNGVKRVTWSIIRTDETTTSSSYTLVQSGPVGETVDFNAAGLGTAGVLQAEINGGIVLSTDQPGATTRAQAKFVVLALNGLEVFVQDEVGDKQSPDRISDFDFGAVAPLNVMVRATTTPVNSSDYKDSVHGATSAALPANTRTGNVLLADANGALPNIDTTVVPSVTKRYLVKNEALGENNGIYILDDAGSGGTPWQMTRSTDADTDPEVTAAMLVPVETGGTLNGDRIFQLATADPITVNTTALTFVLGGGGVGGAGSGADNQIARWDGTTDIQGSGILIDDSDNMTGVTSITMGASATGILQPGAGQALHLRDGFGTARFTVDAAGDTTIAATTSAYMNAGGVITMRALNSGVQLFRSQLFFAWDTAVNPEIFQQSDSTASATGDAFLIHAQDMSGTTSTGGNLSLRAGTGTSTNGTLALQSADGTDRIFIESGGNVDIGGVSYITLRDGGNIRARVFAGQFQFWTSNVVYVGTNPLLYQAADATDGGGGGVTGDLFTLHAQHVTGTGTDNVGGALSIAAGNATNGASTNTGGDLTLNAGSGNTADGVINIGNANTSVINIGNVTDNPTINILGTGGVGYSGDLFFAEDVVSPTFYQVTEDDAVGSDTLLIHAQDNSFASGVAGDLQIHAGTATGTTSTGGDLELRAGAGTSTGGILYLQDPAGVGRMWINPSGSLQYGVVSNVVFGIDGVTSWIMTDTKMTYTHTSKSGGIGPGFEGTADAGRTFTVNGQGNIKTSGSPVGGDLDLTAGFANGTHAGSNIGGDVNITAGFALNGVTLNTGGNVNIAPGSGDTNGVLSLQDGAGVDRLTISAVGAITAATSLSIASVTATENWFDIDTGATALSAANHVRLRSNAGVFEVSENGGAYATVGGGSFDPTAMTQDMAWVYTHATPSIIHTADSTASAVGDLFTISAQDVTGSGASITGGAMVIRGGDSNAGTATVEHGGDLTLRPGSAGAGGGLHGEFLIQDGGASNRISVTSAGNVYLYGQQTSAMFAAGGPKVSAWSTYVELQTNTLRFNRSQVPVLQQSTQTVGTSSATMLIQAQDNSVASSTGGNLDIRPGSGTSVNGVLALQDGAGVDIFRIAANSDILVDSDNIFIHNDGAAGGMWIQITARAGGASASDFFILGQNSTSAGTAGDMIIGAGENTSGGGGNLELRAGEGSNTSNHGRLALVGADGTWRMEIDNEQDIYLNAINDIGLRIGSSTKVLLAATSMTLGAAAASFSLSFLDSTVTPIINQAPDAGSGATGDAMLINSQDVTGGGTTKIGGALTIRAGDSTTGAGTNETGGALTLRPGAGGTGTGVHGVLNLQDGSGTDRLTIDADGDIQLSAVNDIGLEISGTTKALLSASYLTLGSASAGFVLQFLSTALAPTLSQEDDASATSGDDFLIHAQDLITATGTKNAGDLTVRAGNCAGGTSNTGGNLVLRPGSGATAGGALQITAADSTNRIVIDDTGIGFFATTPAGKQSITGALTSVSDSNASAVLTSIISALTTLGLATDNTT